MPSLLTLVRLVLPRRCVACRVPGDWICDECGQQLRPLALPQCARCGAPTAIAWGARWTPAGDRGPPLPRLLPSALAHDRALRALAPGPAAAAAHTVETRR